MSALDTILELKTRMGQSIIGQEGIVERLLIGLLANGKLLVEGLPVSPGPGPSRAWTPGPPGAAPPGGALRRLSRLNPPA
jgi:hypothetical protein